jgi:hypothetical protein
MDNVIISKDKINALKSDVGMKIYKNKNNENHYILRYNKQTLDDISKYEQFRSLVLDKNDNIVAYSPAKSTKVNRDSLSHISDDEKMVNVEELVEGTMINLFFDTFKNEWEIATRSNIGGKIKYVQEPNTKSFREMFLDACNFTELEFDRLPKNYSFSFVLSHPDNIIINQNQKNPGLCCVEAYEITNTDIETSIRLLTNDEIVYILGWTGCRYPERYFKSTEIILFKDWIQDDLYAWVTREKYCFDTMHCMQGVVIKDVNTNKRWKIRCSMYEYLKRLRGNQIKPKYQYLTVRKHKKITEYLHYFPVDADKYLEYKNEIASYIHGLWKSYVGCYVKKQKPVKEWPNEYRIHMFSLHKIFLKDRQTMTLTRVFDYFNNLHESQQMFVLNYKDRPKKPETEAQAQAEVETDVKEAVEEIVDSVV